METVAHDWQLKWALAGTSALDRRKRASLPRALRPIEAEGCVLFMLLVGSVQMADRLTKHMQPLHCSPVLLDLNLQHNNLSDVGCKLIAQALTEQASCRTCPACLLQYVAAICPQMTRACISSQCSGSAT